MLLHEIDEKVGLVVSQLIQDSIDIGVWRVYSRISAP